MALNSLEVSLVAKDIVLEHKALARQMVKETKGGAKNQFAKVRDIVEKVMKELMASLQERFQAKEEWEHIRALSAGYSTEITIVVHEAFKHLPPPEKPLENGIRA